MTGSELTDVLLVEDDDDVALAVAAVLEPVGLVVTQRREGREALREFHDRRPQLVIIDVGLPGDLDGWDVLERVRDLSDVPVLVLSARDGEADKVRGLRDGADDYVTKPFGADELRARVQALLRRAGVARPNPETFVDGTLRVRFDAREVLVDDRRVDVSPLEFRLLSALVRRRGVTLSGSELVEVAWKDPSAAGPERVKFAVLRLRRKLGPVGERIRSVRGFGYRYESPALDASAPASPPAAGGGPASGG